MTTSATDAAEETGEVRQSLRVLASPPSVLALVVLVLNDHVLKAAWPGLVTGKLSDIAGLVFAPLLLAVPLTVLRVPRATGVAVVATGVGFTLAKASALGAAAASQVWSLSGVPTSIRADVTDLFALPALALAWWTHRRWSCAVAGGGRRRLATALGVALLPVGVIATSATNCVPDDGVTGVAAVRGSFTGSPLHREQRLQVSVNERSVLVDQHGQVSAPASADESRLPQRPFHVGGKEACLPREHATCWRVREASPPLVVESSTDGGGTWQVELEMSSDDVEHALDDVDPGCHEDAAARPRGLAVINGPAGPVVAVAIEHAGLLVRGPDDGWRRIAREDLGTSLEIPSVPQGRGPLRRMEPVLPPASSPTPSPPTPTPAPIPTPQPPRPVCPSPTLTTVTPNPLNGPPTTYEVCA